ncbi:alkaline phosphatase D family protein [Hyphococcus luteus]|uniref:Alkaline phosphatase n=1 Tax=Hyphococcus luteus TaxID=2058213 RepID=A0A2S7K5L7_9PROT|nr:alkaline phosphatase D family protein [Marinicaulis flavus]PQA87771.1 alkaline phosphatase [Marinicaulis flavus]
MSNKITRRAALASGLAVSAASCASAPKMTPYVSTSEAATGVFSHGVASGDPARTSVVIWTRIAPPENGSRALVDWEIASDETFTDIVAKGDAPTGMHRDWTVKALATGLAPGSTYYYRFTIAGASSPTGRTRTLPDGAVDKARFAVISCSNYPFGFFNVYDLISRQDDLDAIVHLGDYIYEYGRDGYGGETGARLGRDHEPAHECITLSDYRRRHAQYKADPASQAAHAKHPLIAIWDDHETSNNSWKGGAENHDPATEGEWEARRRASLQAYYEWLPVREPDMTPEAFFRSFSYGDLLTIAALETRLMARARQFEYTDIVPTLKTAEDIENFKTKILWDETREMLGAAQLDYFDRVWRNSVAAGQPWRLVANQVTMAKVTAPDLTDYVTEEDIISLEKEWAPARAFVKSSALGLPSNLDAWDGYPAARERFYGMVDEAGGGGMIVVTGDTHTWWANDLTDKSGKQVGVELGAHSVTSPSPYRNEFLGGKGAEYALLTNRENKDVRFLSGEYHGFIDLTITRDGARAEYKAVDTVESRNYNAFVHAAFDIARTEGGAEFADADELSFKESYLF